jgi:ferredoxin
MATHTVRFFDERYPPLELAEGSAISEHLDAGNSPLLFGCRTGLCGTCLLRVEGRLPPPNEEEQELLDLLAPGDPDARLGCQLRVTGDLRVGPHPEAG